MTRDWLLDWEKLAVVWHRFEANGLTPSQLRSLLPTRARGPCLVVGSGQGYLAADLAEIAPLVPVDCSLPMVRSGAVRRGVRGVVADGRRLPLRDSSVGCCVVATGVLNPDSRTGAREILREVTRVLSRRAVAVIAAFVEHGTWVAAARELGLMVEGRQRNDRLLELHAAPSGALPRLVASWTGISLEAAERRLADHEAIVRSLVELLDQASSDLEARSIEPRGFLEKSFGRPFPVYDQGGVETLVEQAGLRVERRGEDLLAKGLLLLACRKSQSPPGRRELGDDQMR